MFWWNVYQFLHQHKIVSKGQGHNVVKLDVVWKCLTLGTLHCIDQRLQARLQFQHRGTGEQTHLKQYALDHLKRHKKAKKLPKQKTTVGYSTLSYISVVWLKINLSTMALNCEVQQCWPTIQWDGKSLKEFT